MKWVRILNRKSKLHLFTDFPEHASTKGDALFSSQPLVASSELSYIFQNQIFINRLVY